MVAGLPSASYVKRADKSGELKFAGFIRPRIMLASKFYSALSSFYVFLFPFLFFNTVSANIALTHSICNLFRPIYILEFCYPNIIGAIIDIFYKYYITEYSRGFVTTISEKEYQTIGIVNTVSLTAIEVYDPPKLTAILLKCLKLLKELCLKIA